MVSLICYFAAYITYLGGTFYCLVNRFPGLKLAVKRRLKCFRSSKQQTEPHQEMITYSTKIHSYDSANCIELRESLLVFSGVATIEATEAAASVKNAQLNRLSKPEFWHPEFSTQTLLDSITVPHTIVSMAIVLSRARTHGDTVRHWMDHFSSLNL